MGPQTNQEMALKTLSLIIYFSHMHDIIKNLSFENYVFHICMTSLKALISKIIFYMCMTSSKSVFWIWKMIECHLLTYACFYLNIVSSFDICMFLFEYCVIFWHVHVFVWILCHLLTSACFCLNILKFKWCCFEKRCFCLNILKIKWCCLEKKCFYLNILKYEWCHGWCLYIC